MTRLMPKLRWSALSISLVFAAPVHAEIKTEDANGFSVSHQVAVSTDPVAAYTMLRSPAKWWDSEYTATLNADNLYMDAQAAGCFCELIPAKGAEDSLALRGSVQHMRILYAEPGKMLRLTGALGPLQGEAATGILTVTLEPVKGGTVIAFDYVVGGYMRAPVAEMAPLVDDMITRQASRLAMAIGPLVGATRPAPKPMDMADDDADGVMDDDAMAVDPSDTSDTSDSLDTIEAPRSGPGDDLRGVMADLITDDQVMVSTDDNDADVDDGPDSDGDTKNDVEIIRPR